MAVDVKHAGEQARLYYDGARPVVAGDYIRTRTGRLYLVDQVRIQERGKHAGRQHLVTTVMPDGHEPEIDAVVHPIHWYRRPRARSTP